MNEEEIKKWLETDGLNGPSARQQIEWLLSRLAEKDREIKHYRKRADLQEQVALTAVADLARWKARAEEAEGKLKLPHRCSVCNGTGWVNREDSGTATNKIQCRACSGLGLIWAALEDER